MSDLDQYQQDALRTAPALCDDKQLAVFALGVTGEAGEVAEIVKKYVGHGHVLDHDKLAKELGDVLWYLAVMANAIGLPLSEVASRNIAKLKARYPDGFSTEASQARVDTKEGGFW